MRIVALCRAVSISEVRLQHAPTVSKPHTTELSDVFPRYAHDAVQRNRKLQYMHVTFWIYQFKFAGSGRTALDDYSK